MNKYKLELIFPTKEYKKEVEEYLQEFIDNGENEIAGDGGLDKIRDFDKWLEKVQNDLSVDTIDKDRIPATLYLTIGKSDRKIVGNLQIRHFLNKKLLNYDGHIGDSVRPSERRKGYATEQIRLALEKCKELGIDNVLMDCDKANIGSAKSIQKNGGILENEIYVGNEQVRDIVENIFDMYANGHGSVEIVKFLNSNRYLSPTGYRKTGIVQDENKTGYNWNEVTLCNMLKNEVYIGNTVQNKKSVISYKVKKIRTVEKENQIRVDNTHEAIIDKDTFEKVQCIIEKRGTNTKLKYDYLLRGLLYCYHCKRKLQIVLKRNSKRNAKSHPYITCSDAKECGCYPLKMN